MESYTNGAAAYNFDNTQPEQYQQDSRYFREIPGTKGKRNKSVARSVCGYIAVLFVFFALTVYSNVLVMQAKSNVETLEKQLVSLTEENCNKKIQLEQSVDLKKIEEIAISQYGMQRPDNNQIIYVRVVQDDYGEVIKR